VTTSSPMTTGSSCSLMHFLGEVTIHSVESPRARKHSYLDTKEFEPFVDPEAIAPRVEALLDITLDEGRECS
jgi:hypothetical protein